MRLEVAMLLRLLAVSSEYPLSASCRSSIALQTNTRKWQPYLWQTSEKYNGKQHQPPGTPLLPFTLFQNLNRTHPLMPSDAFTTHKNNVNPSNIFINYGHHWVKKQESTSIKMRSVLLTQHLLIALRELNHRIFVCLGNINI